jgi:single-stranded-DNA-specific exonuclease
MLPQARAFGLRPTGGGHVACRLQDTAGGRVRAIAFRALERPLGKALLESPGAPLHLAGRVRLEHWQDCLQVAFQIDDAALVP